MVMGISALGYTLRPRAVVIGIPYPITMGSFSGQQDCDGNRRRENSPMDTDGDGKETDSRRCPHNNDLLEM